MKVIDSEMTVKETLERYPFLVEVFIKRKLMCVGCPTEAYHTMKDVAEIYGFPLSDLLDTFKKAIQLEEESSKELDT